MGRGGLLGRVGGGTLEHCLCLESGGGRIEMVVTGLVLNGKVEWIGDDSDSSQG